MYYTVYKVTNIVNGKFYIGMHKTNDLDDGYMGSGKYLKRAINKYGLENFIKEYLVITDSDAKMKLAEKILVVLDREVSYNLCNGGLGGFSYINRHKLNAPGTKASQTPEAKINRSKGLISWYWSLPENMRIKMAKNLPINDGSFWLGKKHRPETIIKIKNSRKNKGLGETNSQYGTCWVTNGDTTRKIPKPDLDNWLQSGYYRGRS